MDEFSLIDFFAHKKGHPRKDVLFGIGDDAAGLRLNPGLDLLISTDTLVENVHFLKSWDPYDIAYKAAMVNISDMAAMAANPCWITLALTLPHIEEEWLKRFAQGLNDALQQFEIELVGGDTTKGPLCITLTVLGSAPKGTAVQRSKAKPGDKIYVTGELGGAAIAIGELNSFTAEEKKAVQKKLFRPKPRVDFISALREYASAAIDISDGLSSDLNHICEASQVGACIDFCKVPMYELLQRFPIDSAFDLAFHGGDDYELCFTVPTERDKNFLAYLAQAGLSCYEIGIIEEQKGLRLQKSGHISPLTPQGYKHF